MLHRLFLAVLLGLNTVTSSGVSYAANVVTEAEMGRGIVALSGEIVPGDALSLRQAISDAVGRGLHISAIRLNSVGGSVRESVGILRIVRAAGLTTVVGRSDTCASSCFLIFAAGKSKIVYPKARIGVHAASDELNWKTARSLRGTRAVIRIAQRLRVPLAIRNKILKTPPTEMAWLGRLELEKMATSFR